MLFLESDYPLREEIFFRPFDSGLGASLWHYGHSIVRTSRYSFHGLERGDRPYGMFQYTISGRGCLDYAGIHYDLNPGSAMILEIPHNHRYYMPEDSDHWDFIYIALCGSDILRTWNKILERGGPVLQIPEYSRLWETVASLFELKSSDSDLSGFTLASSAYTFTMALQECVWKCTESEKNRPPFIEKVIRYCLSHIHEEIQVDDMAHIAGYSKYYFSRLFLEYEGTSPAVFLKLLRLDFAENLLLTTRYSVKEIAFRCGFEDSGYFCKSFKKQYGISPGEFRAIRCNF